MTPGPNLRHAAALALVGWYLMLPPINDGTPEVTAPPSRWEILFPYDTARDCQISLSRIVGQTLVDLQKPMARDKENFVLRLSSGTCVASDDPRLKEK
jgi:hypothetical protein